MIICQSIDDVYFCLGGKKQTENSDYTIEWKTKRLKMFGLEVNEYDLYRYGSEEMKDKYLPKDFIPPANIKYVAQKEPERKRKIINPRV